MSLLDRLAEARIEEAIARGELDRLPGNGRPLRLEDDSMVPEGLRMACRILKNANCLPPELELRKEIANAHRLLRGVEGEDERLHVCLRLELLCARLDGVRSRPGSLLAEHQYYERLAQRLGSGRERARGYEASG
jgi:hypothetical protein